ncbi:MAG: ATP-binding protein [Candidatus Krumholzibacteriaceae bacterium]|jgi:signal transduction histidine kinase
MNLPAALTLASLALVAALIAVHLFRGENRSLKRLLVLSALVLAGAEASVFLMLLARDPGRVLVHFHHALALAIFFPALALPFLIAFRRENERGILGTRLPWGIVLVVALTLAALLVPVRLLVTRIHFSADGSLWGMEFSELGKTVAVYLLLANMFFLYLFENTYRAAIVADRVTLKYPFLGILAASAINFSVMSRVLAISAIERYFLVAHSCGVIILCGSFLYASIRYPLFGVKVYVNPKQSPSIISIFVAGLYLLSLGGITLLVRLLGLSYDRFVAMVIGIFGVFLLLAVLISGKAKRRLHTFLSENFYLARYNYRKEWRRYGEIMTSGATIDEFLSNVISSLCDTMVVRRGIIWADVDHGKMGFYGFAGEALDPELVRDLLKLTAREPVIVFRKPLVELARPEGKWIHAVARLGQDEESRGLILLGEKDLDRSYTEEDEDFLATIAFQAKLALDNLLMEERIIEARQMDSFNRFASFVIHDLKNTVGMLSLVADNARENIGSAEFQKDALETIRRSVDKMQRLITSLNVHKMPGSLSKTETDLARIAERATEDLKQVASHAGVELEFTGGTRTRSFVDPAAINRVVENLVLNAVEAAGRGGSVRVQVETIDGEWARIAVQDSGAGFDPDYLRDHLFHPFYSTKSKGLGVGLIMCKYLVEAHGGKISVSSSPGRGATVSVTLPAAPARKE